MTTFYIPMDVTANNTLNEKVGNYIQIDVSPSGTGFTIVATDNSGNTINKSNYLIDYILIVLDDKIAREMDKNPDIIFNSNFQNFLQWVMEFRRIVLESRADQEHKARPPFQMGDNTLKEYACTLDHKFTQSVTTYIQTLINRGLNPKTYNIGLATTKYQLRTFPDEYAYFDNCSNPGMDNLLSDVLTSTLGSWDVYTKQPSTPVTQPDLLKQLNNEFNATMADVNDRVSNGDYITKYEIIESLLNNTVSSIDNLTSASNTEFNIIEHAIDADIYYEDLTFNEDDINKALKIPTDTIDLVEQDQITTNLTAAISKYPSGTSASAVASSYNIPSQARNTGNVSAQAMSLLNSLQSSKNIINPSQELLDLAMTKLYINNSGKKVAEYLDSAEIAKLEANQIAKQNNYINLIKDPNPVTIAGTQGYTRMARYDTAYPIDVYGTLTGGYAKARTQKRMRSSYAFRHRSTQKTTITQTGGAEINMDKLNESSTESQIVVGDLQAQISSLDKIYDTQNNTYFDNDNFVNLENLQQKNEFLIEMMNINILYNFLISDSTNEQKNFFDQIQDRITRFKDELTEIWDIMKSRINTADDAILARLTANGVVTINEIQSLLSSIGLAPVASNVSSDEVINSAHRLNLIFALADKYNIKNIHTIAENLHKIYSIKPASIAAKGDSIDKLYSELYTYYQSLRSLNSSLITQYQNIDATTMDMEKIRNFTGNILESNIMTANTYSKELITVLQNFGVKTNTIQDVRDQIKKSKARIRDYETYVKDAQHTLKPNQDVITPTHQSIITNADVINHDMTNTASYYQTYVTGYVSKLADASDNITKYYRQESNLRYVDERKQIVNRNLLELNIIYTGINGEEVQFGDIIIPMLDFNLTDVTSVYDFIDSYNKSYIPLFPDIEKRINIPSFVDDMINSFSAPDPSSIINFITDFLYDNDNMKDYPGLTRKEQYQIANHLADCLVNYGTLIKKYESDDANIPLLNNIIDDISLLQNNIKDAEDVESLVGLAGNIEFFKLNRAAIENDIGEYLSKVQSQTVMADPDFAAMIVSQFVTMANSILYVYNEKIQQMYQTINGLALINNTKSPYFASIQQAQRDAAKLYITTDKIRLKPHYNELTTRTNFDLLTNALATPFATILDNIGKSDNYAEFEKYQKQFNVYETDAYPLLSLMKRMIENGEIITASGRINLTLAYNINPTTDFVNAFTYSSTNIILHDDRNMLMGIQGNTAVYNINRTGTPNYGTFVPDYKSIKPVFTGNAVNYNRTGSYHLPIAYRISNILIPNGTINIGNVNDVIKILNTAKYSFDIIGKLYSISNDIKPFSSEDYNTWDKSVSLSSKEYYTRAEKRATLLSVLNMLNNIQDIIRSNNGKYFNLDRLLLEKTDPSATNTIVESILNIQSKKPENADFNSMLEAVWIFARKAVISWYAMASNLLTMFIFNGNFIAVRDFISELQLDTQNIPALLGEFEIPTENLTTYTGIINNELAKSETQIKKDRDQYPVKPIIGQAVLDQVAYDHFYSNISTPSKEIYVIIALIRKDKLNDIVNPLVAIHLASNQIVGIVNNFNPYLNKDYILKKLTSISIPTIPASPQYTLDDFIRLIDDYKGSFQADLQTSFANLNLPTMYTDIVKEIDDFTKNIGNELRYTQRNPTIHKDPTSIANRLLDITNPVLDSNILNTGFDPADYIFPYDKFIQNQTTANVAVFIRLLTTDYYKIVFREIKTELDRLIADVSSNLSIIKINDLNSIFRYIQTYIDRIHLPRLGIKLVPPPPPLPPPAARSNNDAEVKFVLTSGDYYNKNKKVFDDIHDVLFNITNYVGSNLNDFYDKERGNYETLIQLDSNLILDLHQAKNEILNRNDKLRNMIQVISQVMFNKHYKNSAFIDNTQLFNHQAQTIDNYETISRMIIQKVNDVITKNNKHILTLSQINNYLAFKSTISKLINNKLIVNKIYKRMSFGLIEFYLDVLHSIVICLENKPFESMSNIETYLYQFHYIQLKRCYELFRWIRTEYQQSKQNEDDRKRKAGQNFTSFIKYKIEPLLTGGDINIVFVEFQGLRRYLDEYNAVAMDKVQLHLRINDFKKDDYNIAVMTDAKKANVLDVSFMLDSDPTSPEYRERWEKNELMFTNPKNRNTLRVNFDLMEDIYQFDNPGQPVKNFEAHYNDVYKRMKPNYVGIDFERIYNTLTYPDSDIISNYMSIAPNIVNGKGTVIMTYGYSGTGKSASLFGTATSNGILQATMDNFSNVDIYFRVFEIYGLGTQYNYYWNPEDTIGNYLCFPKFTQSIIHHVIDDSDSSVLKSIDRLVFTNRHDMLAYIMDFEKPATGTKFKVNASNVTSNLGDKNYNTYFDPITNNMIKSTFVKITDKHYRNFTSFVKSVDNARENGIEITNLLRHVAKQIKGTINNPESSRSILVYDFEINLNPTDPTPIYVPFLIYDLPGKEDIYRTYVDTNNNDVVSNNAKARTFRDIPGDIAKERKSTYVSNPLLIPIYDNNAEIISNIMTKLSSVPVTNTGYKTIRADAKFVAAKEKDIVADILKHDITTFAYPPPNYLFNDNSANYTIGDFFKDVTKVTDFTELFKMSNIDDKYFNTGASPIGIPVSALELLVTKGVIGTDTFVYNTANAPKIYNEIRILVSIVLIAYLIKYQLLDVLVEIINVIVNPPDGSDEDSNGGWSRSKIYAFFEAYYINENVVGLLQYLITQVLGKESNIKEQTTVTENVNGTVNKNYKTASRYRALFNKYQTNPNGTVANNYNLIVNPELLNSEGDVLKETEIDKFIDKNNVDPSSGLFATFDTPLNDAFNRMSNVVSLENKGKYDSNKIFRSGGTKFNCNEPPAEKNIINPKISIDNTQPAILNENNRPLLQDFIEPYEQKISFYYVFYVVSNSQMRIKAEEQIKLLNNSMPFIKEMDPSTKQSRCST